MRKVLNDMGTDEAMQLLIDRLGKSKTNKEFLVSMDRNRDTGVGSRESGKEKNYDSRLPITDSPKWRML